MALSLFHKIASTITHFFKLILSRKQDSIPAWIFKNISQYCSWNTTVVVTHANV